MLTLMKDVIYWVGIVAACIAVLVLVITNLYIYFMMAVGAFLAFQQEHASARRMEGERAE